MAFDPANDDEALPQDDAPQVEVPVTMPAKVKSTKAPKPFRVAQPTKPPKADRPPKYAFRVALMADPMLNLTLPPDCPRS